MYRRIVALLFVVALGQVVPTIRAKGGEVPVAWSPDSRWLAFTTQVFPDELLPPQGWSLDLTKALASRPAGPDPDSPHLLMASSWSIWAMRPESGKYVRLEESAAPLTSPAWNPGGKSLAFGRLTPEDNGHSRFEVVIQDGPSQSRVILKESVDTSSVKIPEFVTLRMAWSPDGHYLVVPLFRQTRGLMIIRGDNGRVLKTLEDAQRPAWSPDGSKLAFIRGNDGESLHCLDNNFGAPRHLANIGKALQNPVWHKQSILLLTRASGGGIGGAADPAAELLQFPVDGGKPELIYFENHRNGRERSSSSVTSFSFDREAESLFLTIDVAGPMSEIVWYRPRTHETFQRFNPVEHPVPIDSLGLSPNGRSLAFRAGAPETAQPIGVYEVNQRGFSPVVCDDGARVEWLLTLIAATRQMLSVTLPTAANASGQLIERGSPLPIPGELPSNRGSLTQLRHLGRLGRSLCDRPKDAPALSPARQEFLAEARLFFEYLAEDYRACLNSLEALEAAVWRPEARLKLLSLRAQIFLGLGDVERAQDTIAYLRSADSSKSRRIEVTPVGTTLTEDLGATNSWPDFLALRAQKLGEFKEALNENPLDSPDGDALDPQHIIGPFGPQNLDRIQAEAIRLRLEEEEGRALREPGRARRLLPVAPNSRRVPPAPRPLPPPRRIFPVAPER